MTRFSGLVLSLTLAASALAGPGVQRGKASYYEGVRRNRFSAAHRTLPFGTRVLVQDPRTGRSVVVTILDRGPFIRGRIIDLARGAASDLGMLRAGVIPVTVQVVPRPGELATMLVDMLGGDDAIRLRRSEPTEAAPICDSIWMAGQPLCLDDLVVQPP